MQIVAAGDPAVVLGALEGLGVGEVRTYDATGTRTSV